jgi:glycosyltransferase involved in cell wall biosynthesis
MTTSVIIAAYNAEDTLAETLASVLGQTLPPEEIIVVDDGSIDHTAQVAAGASESIRVIRQENRGAAAALNMGVRLATGDTLGFVDADDLWARDKVAMQTRMLAEQPKLDGVSGHVNMFLCPTNDPETNKRYRLPDGPGPCWLEGAMLLRRHCFERLEPLAENLSAGYFIDWYDRARAAGLVFDMMPSVVLHRRIRPGSLSHRSHKRDIAMVEIARRAIERRRRPSIVPQ